jgi:hypothetical protein
MECDRTANTSPKHNVSVSFVDIPLIMAEIYTGIGGNCRQIMPEERVYTAKILYRKRYS